MLQAQRLGEAPEGGNWGGVKLSVTTEGGEVLSTPMVRVTVLVGSLPLMTVPQIRLGHHMRTVT